MVLLFLLFHRLQTSESDVCRRQILTPEVHPFTEMYILTSKVDPRTERVKSKKRPTSHVMDNAAVAASVSCMMSNAAVAASVSCMMSNAAAAAALRTPYTLLVICQWLHIKQTYFSN